MKRKRAKRVTGIVIIVCIILILALFLIALVLSRRTFRYETSINGIDCSFMSVETAGKKLENDMKNASITLLFADDKEYQCLANFFEIELSNEDALKEILNKQAIESEESESYEEIALYTINEQKVKDYLSSLFVFRESNIRKPENASLELDSNNLLYIKPEVYGNELDFGKACNFMVEALEKGIKTIDFREITNITPEICATDENLISQKDYINSVLSTTINYTLRDGNTYTLDSNTMKDWIYQSEDGSYGIDIEGNLPTFVEGLNEKAKYLLTSTDFNATGLGKIKIAFGRKTYAEIDKEKEMERNQRTTRQW